MSKECYALRVEKDIHQLFTSDEGQELRKELSEIMTIFSCVTKLKKDKAASNLDRNKIMAESLYQHYTLKSEEKKALLQVGRKKFKR